MLSPSGRPVTHPSTEPVRCCVFLQEAAGWNNMLFARATLADLDRLDPERLFCLTQSNDKSVRQIVFSSSQKYGCSV